MANTDATGKLGTGGEFHKFVTQWPTPQHADGERGSEKQVRGNPTLLGAARAWPTPRGTDGEKGGPNQHGTSGDLMLPSAAAQWATPSARDWRSGLASEQTMTRNSSPLNEQAVNLWPTPDVCSQDRDMSKVDPEQQKRPETKVTIGLPTAASMWPTPASGVFNDGESPESWRRRAAGLREKGINGNGAGTPLAIAAKEMTYPSSRPDPTTPTPGDASSPSDPTSPPPSKKRLNPNFVEWLMMGRDRIGWTCTCANRRAQTA
jgi:hypothetical protein